MTAQEQQRRKLEVEGFFLMGKFQGTSAAPPTTNARDLVMKLIDLGYVTAMTRDEGGQLQTVEVWARPLSKDEGAYVGSIAKSAYAAATPMEPAAISAPALELLVAQQASLIGSIDRCTREIDLAIAHLTEMHERRSAQLRELADVKRDLDQLL